MKPNKQTPAAFINALLERHGIPLEVIYHYAVEHQEEISGMKHIFDLKTADEARCFLTIPLLFFHDDAERIIEFVKREEPDNRILAGSMPDAAKFALPLMTAFVYTPGFFAMSWNWCAYARMKAQAETRQKHAFSTVPGTAVRHGWTRRRDCSCRIEYKAASAAVPGFRRFGTPFEFEEGSLETIGAEFDSYYLQFRFIPKAEADLPHPYTLDVWFTTAGDQASHNLRLRDRADAPGGIIYSNPKDGKGIDYTHGIVIQSVEFMETEKGSNE